MLKVHELLAVLHVTGTAKVILNFTGISAVTVTYFFSEVYKEFSCWLKFSLKGIFKRIRKYL